MATQPVLLPLAADPGRPFGASIWNHAEPGRFGGRESTSVGPDTDSPGRLRISNDARPRSLCEVWI